jgi:hypothetical protein
VGKISRNKQLEFGVGTGSRTGNKDTVRKRTGNKQAGVNRPDEKLLGNKNGRNMKVCALLEK